MPATGSGVRYEIGPLTGAGAEAIAAWRYPGEYEHATNGGAHAFIRMAR